MSWLGIFNDAARVPEPLPVPLPVPQMPVWCPNTLCDTWRDYDVLPGHPASKLYGAIRPFAFCVHCGDQVDVEFEEGVA